MVMSRSKILFHYYDRNLRGLHGLLITTILITPSGVIGNGTEAYIITRRCSISDEEKGGVTSHVGI